jgi:hypothetical protein
MAMTSSQLPPDERSTALHDFVREWIDQAIEAGADVSEAIAAVEDAAWSQARVLCSIMGTSLASAEAVAS